MISCTLIIESWILFPKQVHKDFSIESELEWNNLTRAENPERLLNAPEVCLI